MSQAYTHTNSRGVTYHLNSKEVILKGGRKQTIYYFTKDHRADTATALPDTKVVAENQKNGFLVVKNATQAA